MLLLAVAGIGAAGRAGFHLRAESGPVRERQAFDDADAAVESLTQGVLAREAAGARIDVRSTETKDALTQIAKQTIGPLFEAGGGFCDTEGSLLATVRGSSKFDWPVRVGARSPIENSGNGGPDRPPSKHLLPPIGNFAAEDGAEGGRPTLLPADREALLAACRQAMRGRTDHKRVSLPHDLLMFSVRGATDRVVAWTLIRLPPADANPLGIAL